MPLSSRTVGIVSPLSSNSNFGRSGFLSPPDKRESIIPQLHHQHDRQPYVSFLLEKKTHSSLRPVLPVWDPYFTSLPVNLSVRCFSVCLSAIGHHDHVLRIAGLNFHVSPFPTQWVKRKLHQDDYMTSCTFAHTTYIANMIIFPCRSFTSMKLSIHPIGSIFTGSMNAALNP